jgi:hypothetical protein
MPSADSTAVALPVQQPPPPPMSLLPPLPPASVEVNSVSIGEEVILEEQEEDLLESECAVPESTAEAE